MKIKINILNLLFSLFLLDDCIAQEKQTLPAWEDKFTLGLGIGFPYGGLGGNALVYLNRNLGIFGAVGYALAGAGYNVGTKIRLNPKQHVSRFDLYFTAMYGYNAGVLVINESHFNKLFYGPSFGIGFDYRSKALNKGYLSFALVIPVRNSEYSDYKDNLEKNYNVEFGFSLPFVISVGYQYIIN